MQEYPYIGGYQIVNVEGSWGRPMLRDARHQAPEPCINCSNLCLSRNDERMQDVLHCKNPGGCPSLVPVNKPTPMFDRHFLDESPTMPGYLSSTSPCWSCAYKESAQSGMGTLEYCNRRRDNQQYCPVRGSMTSDEYAQYEIEREQREAQEAEEELEREMQLIESVDLTGYGSF